MRALAVGALGGAVGVLAVMGLMSGVGRVEANPAASVGSTELITVSTPLGDHRQQLTVIDPRQRVMGVYHVDHVSGEIALRSVRNIHWDLQLSEFNSASPLPREVRSMLEQR